MVDPFSDSIGGTVDLQDFVFDTDENPVSGKFQVCVASVYPPYEQSCAAGVNNPQHAPETITIEVPTTGIARSNSQNNFPSQEIDESSSDSGIGETNLSPNQLTDNRYYEGYDWRGVCNNPFASKYIGSQPCNTLVTLDGNALTSQGKHVMEAALCPHGQGVIGTLEFFVGSIPEHLKSDLATACGW